MQLLARHGVQEAYWLVDPDAAVIEVFWLNGDRYLLASHAAGDERVSSPLMPALVMTPDDIVRM